MKRLLTIAVAAGAIYGGFMANGVLPAHGAALPVNAHGLTETALANTWAQARCFVVNGPGTTQSCLDWRDPAHTYAPAGSYSVEYAHNISPTKAAYVTYIRGSGFLCFAPFPQITRDSATGWKLYPPASSNYGWQCRFTGTR